MKKLKSGDLVVIHTLDHSSEDKEGWQEGNDKSIKGLAKIWASGFFVKQDRFSITLAGWCGEAGDFSTFVHVLKNPSMKVFVVKSGTKIKSAK